MITTKNTLTRYHQVKHDHGCVCCVEMIHVYLLLRALKGALEELYIVSTINSIVEAAALLTIDENQLALKLFPVLTGQSCGWWCRWLKSAVWKHFR